MNPEEQLEHHLARIRRCRTTSPSAASARSAIPIEGSVSDATPRSQVSGQGGDSSAAGVLVERGVGDRGRNNTRGSSSSKRVRDGDGSEDALLTLGS